MIEVVAAVAGPVHHDLVAIIVLLEKSEGSDLESISDRRSAGSGGTPGVQLGCKYVTSPALSCQTGEQAVELFVLTLATLITVICRPSDR